MKIGILGGGQLGRMLALAGYPLGLRFRFFDPAPNATAGQLAEHIVADYSDTEALKRFADGLDVVTYEFENVPPFAVTHLSTAVPVFPPLTALETAQERLTEKNFFAHLGIPTPTFAPIDTPADFDAALAQSGLPAVLKTRRLGYDGKGQSVLRTVEDVERARALADTTALIAEQFVPFDREVSLLSVRGRNGETAFYPLVENHHRDGILRRSLAPAPDLTPELQAQAETYARRVLEELNYVGVLAIEFFQQDGQLLANEMAPRVHNSGHWTLEGAETSQFANHLRAILGWPLGATTTRGYAAMVNLIGELPSVPAMLQIPGAYLHLYDKSPAPGRKIGHVNVLASDAATRAQTIAQIENLLGESKAT